MRRQVESVWSDTRGATAVEYGLIAAIMVVAIIAAFQSLGGTTNSMWSRVTSKVVTASS